MSSIYEDERTTKRLKKILSDVNMGHVPQAEVVSRLLIEYLIRYIDQYDTASKGKTDEFNIRLPTNTGKTTKIYFTAEFQDSAIPANSFVSHPRTPVGNILIINMGPNTLKFATNRYPGDEDVNSQLKTQEFKTIATGNRNTIFSLFLKPQKEEDIVEEYTDIRVEFIY